MMKTTNSAGMKLISPKEFASEYLLGAMEADVGTWSGLDESGPDKLGVGLFFRTSKDDGSINVISMVPGSSAHSSGLVNVGDKLLSVDNEDVFGFSLIKLRDKIHGMPGSYIVLDFERLLNNGEVKKFRVNCMRGSPQFIAYQDRFGIANASRLDELVMQKREEQKFNSMVEKQLKLEQARFAVAQKRRRESEDEEQRLRERLEAAQKELYKEEQEMEKAQEKVVASQREEMSKRNQSTFPSLSTGFF